jgi:glycerophosphoryl diester phosphodiesterase
MTNLFVITVVAMALFTAKAYAQQEKKNDDGKHKGLEVQLGPRPFYLVDGMDPSPLKSSLKSCENDHFHSSDFSIAHRGAPLQFPEHTTESSQAGARMGAGIVEADVTFTSDGELVVRHDECDLATTTNIVTTSLNNKCTVPWTGPNQNPAPKCCTSDLTLAEFKSLTGKMDASVPSATTPEEFLGGTADWRTDLYTGRGTLMTFKESIELNKKNGVKHTPELKAGNPDRINAVFGSQANYAQKMIDELNAEGVNPKDVYVQSFNPDDVVYWIQHDPEFGKQAVYLDDQDPTVNPPIPPISVQELQLRKAQGVTIIAPPIFALLSIDSTGNIVPSDYAKLIKSMGFDVIAWSFERSDLRKGAGPAGFYWLFDPNNVAIKKDSDMYKALDVLARQVGILGMFTDWPATVTYYADCMLDHDHH